MEETHNSRTSRVDQRSQCTCLIILLLLRMLIGDLQCLASLPHDPKMAPIVPRDISLIPPVNETSSFYDGMQWVNVGRLWVLMHLA